MAIFRVNKNKNYTVMSNYHLKDANISFKAKGLLSMMLSLPDDWDYSIKGIISISKENKTSIQSTLKELEENKYLKRTRKQNEKGQFGYIYDIYEKPWVGKPCIENLVTDNLCTENMPQINTNIQNTKKQNTNNILSCEVSNVEENNDKVKTETYKEIIDYMNTVNEHQSFNVKQIFSYRYNSKDTKSHINARLREGYTINDFKDVIWWGYRKFVEFEFKTQNGESSVKYFRPSTLFSEKHFEEYLNEYRANTK